MRFAPPPDAPSSPRNTHVPFLSWEMPVDQPVSNSRLFRWPRPSVVPPTEVAKDREVAPVVGQAATFHAFIADELIPEITQLQAIERGLKVMDTTALSLCMDTKLPIYVFALEDGNIRRVVSGERVGTLVSTP